MIKRLFSAALISTLFLVPFALHAADTQPVEIPKKAETAKPKKTSKPKKAATKKKTATPKSAAQNQKTAEPKASSKPKAAAKTEKAAKPKTTSKPTDTAKKEKKAEAAAPSCLDCHPDKKEGKTVHPAIEMGCPSCHTGLHQGEKPAPKLVSPVPDLCFTCHDKAGFEKKSVHAPVAGGMCGSCHNPHATAVPKLLASVVPDLCFSCHDKKTLAKMTAHVSAAGGQCLTCHDPHGSDGAYVLNQLVEGHCESCHDETAPRHVMLRISPGDSHPLKGRPDPLHKGKDLACPSCHNPHASEQQRVSTKGLKSPVPLCLRCHTKIMVRP